MNEQIISFLILSRVILAVYSSAATALIAVLPGVAWSALTVLSQLVLALIVLSVSFTILIFWLTARCLLLEYKIPKTECPLLMHGHTRCIRA